MPLRIFAPTKLVQDVKSSFNHASSLTREIRSWYLWLARHAPAVYRLNGISLRRSYGSTSTSPPSVPSNLVPTQHNSLQTFLTHARDTSLAPTSTTYLGTRYEYLALRHLSSQLNFSLTRVGGRGDSGIDLLGTWPLPALLRRQTQPLGSTEEIDDPVRVLLQCKRLTRVTGPSLIRELEGSFRGAPHEWRRENALGVMVCTRPATKGIRDAMGRSTRGLVWILLEELKEAEGMRSEGNIDEVHKSVNKDSIGLDAMSLENPYTTPQTRIRQFLYNASAASQSGLQGVNVGVKYDESGNDEEVQLLWQGKPIQFRGK